MDGVEHAQLLEKLAQIKQDIAVNTVKTSAIEVSVAEVKAELKDIRLSFITHAEYEARHKALQDYVDENDKSIPDHEARIRRLEYWGAAAIGILTALQFYFNFLHK